MNVNNASEVGVTLAEIGCFDWPLSAAVVAGSQPIGETSIGVIGPGPQALALSSVYIHPSAAVTASDSNYFTFSVYKRTAGGAGVLLASGSSSVTASNPTGSWAAWTPVPLTLVAGAFVSPGDAITVLTTKTGTPQTIPQLYLAGFVTLN